ncbi:MAG TPA: ATP synthase F1 subunit gamma [Bacteroidales bacterium]|nr:MAG: ATP synthase gamma chain [Bacteroidetes bacterium ADurb.Bin217]HPM13358.1 ATP synthase F1 subunit gamma [Bacteroidales bacterium]
MAGIKEIRTRIASVNNTQKITSAMKMVSAAKLRKAQQAVQQMRPYSEKLQEILVNVSADSDANQDNVYAKVRPAQRILIVAIASNGGLCGGFNSNIGKATIALIQQEYATQFAKNQVHIYTVGKKVRDMLKSKGYEPTKSFVDIYDDLSYDTVSKLSTTIMSEFANGTYDRVILLYNSFKNAATQVITNTQFLPLVAPEQDTLQGVKKFNYDYIFEPDKEYIISELIPRSLKIQFFSALLDSFASEHGARMTAMHKATDNAGEMLKSLRIDYNKARQASITNEILEIVSGANALKG